MASIIIPNQAIGPPRRRAEQRPDASWPRGRHPVRGARPVSSRIAVPRQTTTCCRNGPGPIQRRVSAGRAVVHQLAGESIPQRQSQQERWRWRPGESDPAEGDLHVGSTGIDGHVGTIWSCWRRWRRIGTAAPVSSFVGRCPWKGWIADRGRGLQAQQTWQKAD